MHISALVLLVALVGATAGAKPPDERPCAGDESACSSCAVFCRHAPELAAARLEVAAIRNGIVIHLTASDPDVVLGVQRYAFERHKLLASGDIAKLEELCGMCRRYASRLVDVHSEVAESAHGVFTLLTSDNPETVRRLHAMAAKMTLYGNVRGS